MTASDVPVFEHAARVERKRLFRRREFVFLLATERVFLQFGGSEGRQDGWITKSVVDPEGSARSPVDTMLQDYLRRGFRQTDVDLSVLPTFPEKLLEPHEHDDLD